MRRWSHYLGGVVAAVGLLGFAAGVNGESCSLDLKKVNRESSSRADYIFRATYPQSFMVPITEGMRFGGQADVPKFADVIKKEPEKYQAKHPVRGVFKLGSQSFGYVLDSSVKKPDDEKKKGEEKKAEAEAEESGGLLSSLSRMLTGRKAAPKQAKSFQVVPYDRLYFDLDHDGDLTDEKVIEAQSTQSYGSNDYFATSFPRIDVAIEIDSTKMDYAFTLTANSQGSGSHGYLSGSVNAAAYREGEITLAGKKHRLVLIDFNSNGRFDDESEINSSVRMADGQVYVTQGDRLYVDPDLNEASRSAYDLTANDDCHPVGKFTQLDGRFYELTVSPAGDKLTLEPSDVGVGYVSNPNQNYSAVVYGDRGLVKIRSDESGMAPLPIGPWKLQAYTLDRTGMEEPKKADSESETSILGLLTEALGPTMAARAPRSTIVSATATMKYEAVEVNKDGTVELPFGPPYRPAVDVQYPQGSNQVSLGMSLIGSADEICTDMQINGARPGKPEFSITTADGKKVADGVFEYG